MPHSDSEVFISSPPGFGDAVVFTVDVEDYFMSPETIAFEDWPLFSSRIEEGMKNCLALLKGFNVRATFFFVGWLAERYPQIVEWTLEHGHEIGSHTYTHHYVHTLNQQQFSESVEKSLQTLRSIAGQDAVIGHRAPAFSLDRSKHWQFDVLKKNGIVYDSSINPHGTYLYGDSAAPRHPYWLNEMLELPPAAIKLFGRACPVGGGGTLRILPSFYQRWARKRYKNEGYPPVIYMHPWEFLCDHPPLKLPMKQSLIHHWGLRSVDRKLRRLFEDYRGVSMDEYARAILQQSAQQ